MTAMDTGLKMKPLHVQTTGQGPDIVLLHGWGMHGGYWDGLVSVLKEHYRVHCIDLPGHGRSDYHGEQTLQDYADVIVQTMQQHIESAAVLMGWSLGGLIAQRMVLDHAQLFRRLILMASTASFVQREGWPHALSADVLHGFARDLLEDYKGTLKRFLALQVRGSERQQQGLRELKARLFVHGEPRQEALRVGLELLRDTDLRHELPMLAKPVCIIGGERDTLVPVEVLNEMAQLLPDASTHSIKGAGHAPFLSHPQDVLMMMKEFLPT